MLVCADSDVDAVLELEELLPVIADAFERQGRGAVERPERPHFPIGTGLQSESDGRSDDSATSAGNEPLGTGLTMPAYLHGDPTYATKLVSVHPENPPERPTVHAQVVLTDARTGEPVALLAGERLTNARTGCIGGIAVDRLAVEPVTLGVIGAGTQARWQTRAIDAAVDLESVRVYSPSDSRHECVQDLQELGIDARATDTAAGAVRGANVIVTATTATEPTFPSEAVADGTLVVAVGAYTAETQELPPELVERAARLYADVPDEAAETGDLLAADHDEPVPLSAAVSGGEPRVQSEEVVVVKSVGTAVLDAAAGLHLFEAAQRQNRGETVEL